LIARLDVDQLGAVVDLALDLKQPWMKSALLGLPAAGDDQAERVALLLGLDRQRGQASARTDSRSASARAIASGGSWLAAAWPDA
jgi:hypothetical protein